MLLLSPLLVSKSITLSMEQMVYTPFEYKGTSIVKFPLCWQKKDDTPNLHKFTYTTPVLNTRFKRGSTAYTTTSD